MPCALAGAMSLSRRSPTKMQASAGTSRVAREEVRDPCPLQPLPVRADGAEQQSLPCSRSSRPSIPGPQLEGIEVAGHRFDPLAHARHRDRLAAAQRLDHVAAGVCCEGRDRLVRRGLDHGLVDPHPFHAAGRGDRAVDRHLPGKLEIDRAADVEQDGAIAHVRPDSSGSRLAPEPDRAAGGRPVPSAASFLRSASWHFAW